MDFFFFLLGTSEESSTEKETASASLREEDIWKGPAKILADKTKYGIFFYPLNRCN